MSDDFDSPQNHQSSPTSNAPMTIILRPGQELRIIVEGADGSSVVRSEDSPVRSPDGDDDFGTLDDFDD